MSAMIGKITGTHQLFIEEGANPVIAVKEHHHFIGEGEEEEEAINGKIGIDTGDLELEISLPISDLKKLIIAATHYLKTDETACFHEDEYRTGDGETIPTREALQQSRL